MQETSLPKIIAVLRARWWLVVVLAVPVLLASVAYAATRAPEYRSEAVISFSPGPTVTSGSSFVRLVRTYQLVATSPDVLRAAEKKAGVPDGAFGDAVSVESPGDTLQLSLAVITGSRDSAERGAEAAAEAVVAIADRDPLVVADFLIGPTAAGNVTPLRQTVAVAAGLALGPLPGIALAFLLEGARPRVRTRQDLAALGVPLLSSVSGRHLRRLRRGRPRAKDLPRLPGLQTYLRQSASDGGASAVVLTSASGAEADLTTLTDALSASGPDDLALLARPGLLTDDGTAAAAVREHGMSLVLLPAGTPYDVAEECLQLIGRLGAEPVGAVLVR